MSYVKAFLLISLPLGLGCAGREADMGRPDTYPVDGKLLVDGQPATNTHIAFYPVGGTRTVCPVAITGPGGTFRLTTYAAGDGAPDGEYVVTLLWLDPAAPTDPCECPDLTVHDRLHGRYADARTSQLRALVGPGRTAIHLEAVASGSWNTTTRITDRRPGLTFREEAERERARNAGDIAFTSERQVNSKAVPK